MEILKKLDKFLSETVFAADFPKHADKYMGERPIQFLKFWMNYRPGDRINARFTDEGIELYGTNSEGNFAGSKYEKENFISDPEEMDAFKMAEGEIWNFV